MKTVLIGGYSDNLNNAATEYNALSGGHIWTATEVNVQAPIPTSGTLSKLKVSLSAAPTGNPYIFTVRLGTADTTLVGTVAVGSTTAEDSTHNVAVSAGQLVNIKSSYNAGSAPTNTPDARWSTIFEGANSSESIILGNSYRTTATTHYCGLMHSGTASADTSDTFGNRSRMPLSGTLSKLYACMSVSDSDSLTYTVYQGGTATSLSGSIVSRAWTLSPTAGSIAISDDDYCQMRIIEAGNIVAGYCGWGMVFTPGSTGCFIMLHSSRDVPANNEYHGIITPGPGTAQVWTATEATHSKLANAFTAKKIRACISAAPGATASRIFTVRKYNNEDTPLSVTLSGASEVDDYVSSDVTISDWDQLLLKHTQTGTPAAGSIQIGIVGQIPTTGWVNISKIHGIASSSYSKVNGISVSSISKIHSISV